MRQIGRGREFEKLREYVPGDGFDEIHWKATARRGRPITKVFQVERTQEIYVVIDASRLSARPAGDETVLERAIAAALIVGAAAERRGDLFGLAAFSTRWKRSPARATEGALRRLPRCDLSAPAAPGSPDFDEIATFLRLRLRRRALLLFLTSLDDPVLAENFARATELLARRHLVMAGMLRPPSAQPLFHDAGVESHRRNLSPAGRASGLEAAARAGIDAGASGRATRSARPGKFGGGLIGLYDEVKQRQLL